MIIERIRYVKINMDRIIGRIRLFFGFCPKCNSDAPHLYECTVCNWNKEPKKNWWTKFIKEYNN